MPKPKPQPALTADLASTPRSSAKAGHPSSSKKSRSLRLVITITVDGFSTVSSTGGSAAAVANCSALTATALPSGKIFFVTVKWYPNTTALYAASANVLRQFILTAPESRTPALRLTPQPARKHPLCFPHWQLSPWLQFSLAKENNHR